MPTADEQLTRDVTEFLCQGGSVITGFADLSPIAAAMRYDLPVGIVFALAVNPEIVATLREGPTREYAAEYERLNHALAELGSRCVQWLQQRGYNAIAQGGTVKHLDRASLATPLPHKTIATRAGIGWIGKCALLVTESHGSAIRMNTVLTDAPLAVGRPIEYSRCGHCDNCKVACPAGAPTGEQWHAGLERQNFYDAFACALTAGRLSGALGIAHTICGRCIAACPWTQKHLARTRAAQSA